MWRHVETRYKRENPKIRMLQSDICDLIAGKAEPCGRERLKWQCMLYFRLRARFSECVHRENCLPTFWVHVIFDDWTICSCLMVLLNDWLCITFFGDIGNILLRELASLSPRLGGYKLPPAAILSRQSLNKECNSSCTYLHTHMV